MTVLGQSRQKLVGLYLKLKAGRGGMDLKSQLLELQMQENLCSNSALTKETLFEKQIKAKKGWGNGSSGKMLAWQAQALI
jgi:hypothetical protein